MRHGPDVGKKRPQRGAGSAETRLEFGIGYVNAVANLIDRIGEDSEIFLR
jgi:hypothetical protein